MLKAYFDRMHLIKKQGIEKSLEIENAQYGWKTW